MTVRIRSGERSQWRELMDHGTLRSKRSSVARSAALASLMTRIFLRLPARESSRLGADPRGACALDDHPLTHGLFTLPEEEDTVVRAVPAQILALSRVPEDTQTVAVPRELLELSRREEGPTRSVHARHAELEPLVWDAWYGSDQYQEEPVFDLSPSQRLDHSAIAAPPQKSFPDTLSADDLLFLEALAPGRRFATPAVLLMLAALCASATYWVAQ
jgi:hypothetical protein